jgi:hypothetical protein
MKKELEEYVNKCDSCQVNKLLSPRKSAPMESTITADHSSEKSYVDIIGPLPETKKGNEVYI